MTEESGTNVAPSAPVMGRATQAVFLERQSYRRRRLLDLARLLPLLGVLLLLIPLLWPGADSTGYTSGGDRAMTMSGAIIYVFSVWAALILGAVLFGIGARRWGGENHRPEQGRD